MLQWNGKACILSLVSCFLCHPKFEVNLLRCVSLFDSDSELEKQDSCAHLYLTDMKGFDQTTLKCLQMLCELMTMQQLVEQQLFPVSYTESDMECEL